MRLTNFGCAIGITTKPSESSTGRERNESDADGRVLVDSKKTICSQYGEGTSPTGKLLILLFIAKRLCDLLSGEGMSKVKPSGRNGISACSQLVAEGKRSCCNTYLRSACPNTAAFSATNFLRSFSGGFS